MNFTMLISLFVAGLSITKSGAERNKNPEKKVDSCKLRDNNFK
jgi:hypothetical protein